MWHVSFQKRYFRPLDKHSSSMSIENMNLRNMEFCVPIQFFWQWSLLCKQLSVISLLTPFKLFFWCLPQKIKYENISQCMHKHFLCEYLGSNWYLRLIYSLVNPTENKVELWNSFHMKLVSLHNLLKKLPKFLLNWTSFPHFP